MARPTPAFDPWPLLPRPAGGRPRPEDDPARAAVAACIGLAALLLPLRLALPGSGLGPELAKLVALVGCSGGFALLLALVAMLVGVAVVTPVLTLPAPMRQAALRAFDNAVHLAFVLSVTGVLGIIVLHERVPPVAIWFTGQAALLWACHRTRLWLAGPSIA
ncbi:hypothetical protein GXW74_17665 [Roseomonas eburnea]|uniref:Uncharacterized protein n=1 Tax=Neoroseomonas eburnea TaxID=1346889 RepID=A0A9X9XF38_9PROT|nr:hypothetical protein [Neoroseomonas eburnea]MBR0682324.1 hypothetical protein [Neoroseomonas eburnea]